MGLILSDTYKGVTLMLILSISSATDATSEGGGLSFLQFEAPVFERFGLPRGQRGVILMSSGFRELEGLSSSYAD